MAQLGLNLPLLITQIVTFIILLVLLRLFAYKPLMRYFDERSKASGKAWMLPMRRSRLPSMRKKMPGNGLTSSPGRAGRIERAVKAGEDVKQNARRSGVGRAYRAGGGGNSARTRRRRQRGTAGVRRPDGACRRQVIERSLDKEQHRELIEKVLKEGEKKQG